MLIISRIIQAIGAAAAMATNQGIITETFSPSEGEKKCVPSQEQLLH